MTETATDLVGAEPDPVSNLRRLSDVPVELSVEIGRAKMTVGETLELRPGAIVTLNRLAGEPVDLLVNGTPIARGEVVVVDEDFGLRITQVIDDVNGAVPSATAEAPPFEAAETPAEEDASVVAEEEH